MASRNMQLPKPHRNQVFRSFEQLGLDARDFEWLSETVESEHQDYWEVYEIEVPILIHTPTGSRFAFDFRGRTFAHAIVEPSGLRHREVLKFCDWDDMHSKALVPWLSRIKSESQIPDLWAEAARLDKDLSEAIGDNDNLLLTADEIAMNEEALDKVRTYLVDAVQSDDRQEIIENEVAWAKAHLTDKITKREWRILLIGWMMSTATSIGLEPSQYSGLFHLVRESLGRMISHYLGVS